MVFNLGGNYSFFLLKKTIIAIFVLVITFFSEFQLFTKRGESACFFLTDE